MLCYQILHGRCNTTIASCFVHHCDNSTRGNQLKLYCIDLSVYVLYLSVPSHALTFIAYVCSLHIFKCCVVCKFNNNMKSHCTVDVTKHYLSNTEVNVWNSLPDTVVTACYPFVVSWLNSI